MQILRHILAAPKLFKWEMPIRHLIPSDYECTGGGAYCDEFKF